MPIIRTSNPIDFEHLLHNIHITYVVDALSFNLEYIKVWNYNCKDVNAIGSIAKKASL